MVADPVQVAAALLSDASDVTLLAHVQPDADSLGSALALGITLHRRGVDVRVSFATPDAVPETLRPLDVLGLVVSPAALPPRPGLLVVCDAAEPSRLGGLRGLLDTAATTVMIDHHASNPGFGDVQILDPAVEATAVLAHAVIRAMGGPPDADVARCLYAGLVTDTRGFRTAGAGAHRMAADLIDAGVDAEALVRPIMDTHPHAWLAVLGSALRRCVLDPAAAGGLGMAWTSVGAADVARFRVEEVDGVVDVVRTTAEAEVAAVLKQVGERRWSVSLRSHGSVDVAAAAERIGGGGHRAAAGVTLEGSEEDVLRALRGALEPAVPIAG